MGRHPGLCAVLVAHRAPSAACRASPSGKVPANLTGTFVRTFAQLARKTRYPPIWRVGRHHATKVRKDSAQGSLSESLVCPSLMQIYAHSISLVNEKTLYHVLHPTPSDEEVQCQYRKCQNRELSCQIG